MGEIYPSMEISFRNSLVKGNLSVSQSPLIMTNGLNTIMRALVLSQANCLVFFVNSANNQYANIPLKNSTNRTRL